MQNIRPAAVAGMFYPAEPKQLARDVQQYLADARPFDLVPKALIVPHAGYVYSGAIAATAYATLRKIAPRIHRVVLLGPTHRVAVRGLALPGADAFDAPLGRVTLDTDSARAIAHLPQVSVSAQAHALEHALEVQLPFLQSILTDFTLLPLAVGMATAEEVAEVLETVWGGDETLIVISSDLSHYLPYATAQRVDQATTQSILKLQQPIAHDHAIRGETKSLGGDPQDNAVRIGDSHHLLRLERKCGDGLRLCDIFARAGSCHGQHPITDTFAARNDLASPKGPLTMASTNILPRLSLRMNKSRRYF